MVDYKEVIDLGFVRKEYEDSVFFNIYGYNPFELTYGNDIISFVWKPNTRQISMYINSNTYKSNIDIEEVKQVITMLRKNI